MTQASALFITLLLECTAAALWWMAIRSDRPTLERLLLATVTVSLLTHPVAWWANHALVGALSQWTRVGVIEVSVVLIEGALYVYLVPLARIRAFGLALLTNAASFGVGLIILALLRG